MSPLVLDEPTGPAVPLLVTVPHAGTLLSPGLEERLQVPAATLQRLADPWVDRLAAEAPAVGAWLLYTRWARAVVDVNRAADEFAGASGFRDTAKARAGLGVVPTLIAGKSLYARPLSAEEVGARLELAYHPYHALLADLLARIRAEHGIALLLDVHSMPDGAWASQRPAVDVVLGDCFGRAAASRIVAMVQSAFRRHGLWTARNRPYAGGFVTQHYGRPERGIEVLQIELRRSLYMDERRMEPNADFARVASILRSVFEDVAIWLRSNPPLSLALAGE